MRALVVAWIALIGSVAAAHAGEGTPAPDGRIAIVEVEITGDAAPELRGQMQQSIREGLGRSGHHVLGLEQVMHAIEGEPELIGCTSTTCLQRIRERVQANRFLRMQVDGSGAAYTVVLELLSHEVDGGVVRRLEKSCTVCTISELGDVVAEGAAELVSTNRVEKVPVTIVSRPTGATIRIDGGEPSQAPRQDALLPGSHTIEARLDGHAVSRKTIEVTGSSEPQRFELVLTPMSASEDDRASRPYRYLKWATAGGAGAALITGVVLVSLDGDGTCELDPPQRECPEIYDTMTGGVLTLVAGVGLGAASGWMFWKDGRRARADEGLGLVPTSGGARATFTVRW